MSHLDQHLRKERREQYAARVDEIQECLQGMLREEGIAGSMLIDRDGHPIAASGDLSTQDPDLVVALTAASFAALGQVFTTLGSGFMTQVHVCGKERGLCLFPLDRGALLLVSWDKGLVAGAVDGCQRDLVRLLGLLEMDQS